jgi:hypothetical protein
MLDRTKTQELMNELKATAERAVLEYNEYFQSGKFADASAQLTVATEAINKYTANAQAMCFDEIIHQTDPLAYACKIYSFDTIRIKDVKIEGSIVSKKQVDETDKPIALEKLQKYAKNEGIVVGADKHWLDAIHHLNYLLTVRVCEELGLDPAEVRDCYRIRDVAKEYQLGIAHAADGNAQTLGAIEKIMKLMITSEPYAEPTMHEVTYLNRVWSKKGKGCLSVSVSNHRQMCNLMMEIAHKLITGEAYSVDYKRAKGK